MEAREGIKPSHFGFADQTPQSEERAKLLRADSLIRTGAAWLGRPADHHNLLSANRASYGN